MDSQAPVHKVCIDSGISVVTGEPFVAFHWGEHYVRMSVADAHRYALGILEACETAEACKVLIRFAQAQMNLTSKDAIRVVTGFLGAPPEDKPPETPDEV